MRDCLRVIELIRTVWKVAWQRVLRGLSRTNSGAYALIACISGTIPMIRMTPLRL